MNHRRMPFFGWVKHSHRTFRPHVISRQHEFDSNHCLSNAARSYPNAGNQVSLAGLGSTVDRNKKVPVVETRNPDALFPLTEARLFWCAM